MRPLDDFIKRRLDRYLETISDLINAETVAIVGPIMPGIEQYLRVALESIPGRDAYQSIVVILDTPGGIVEVVQRMVNTIRFNYHDVTVIVPDRAMSAGTIFALSANRIMMDYFSCLGPIDPQIEKDGKLVPALSYLNQFERLKTKAEAGNLTTAEYALLDKLDLGELYQFEQARELSIELLIEWLSRYKFKDWTETEERKLPVTEEMKKDRAEKIAALLNDAERWHSHGRAINMDMLQEEVGLQIEDISKRPELYEEVRRYFDLLRDYMNREQLYSFVHTRGYF